MKKIAIFVSCFMIFLFTVGCSDSQNEVLTLTTKSVTQPQSTTEATSEGELSTEIITEKSYDTSQPTSAKVSEKRVPETTATPSTTEKATSFQPTTKTEITTKVVATTEINSLDEKEIDIDYYIVFATNYAESIGLTIDNLATDCWDNPISVTSKTSNVKKNITYRLDRYKNIEGFSSVCIWYEKVGDNSFEIYIGYA